MNDAMAHDIDRTWEIAVGQRTKNPTDSFAESAEWRSRLVPASRWRTKCQRGGICSALPINNAAGEFLASRLVEQGKLQRARVQASVR